MNLIIVESPSKARTIKKFLGPDFEIEASFGHIKDLPEKVLGVDKKNDFTPQYVIIPKQKKTVEAIRRSAEKAEKVFIATDPDREGEAIAFHVAEIISGAHPSPYRSLFYEITLSSVRDAIESPISIDKHKVDAQIARRVMDRLLGYEISPLLWKTVRKGLSAGRVQSVALRLICERETEILAFVPREYWSIHATFSTKEIDTFSAELVKFKGKKVDLPDQKAAEFTCDFLKGLSYYISSIKIENVKNKPFPPYTTSTLQQDASRRLNYSAKKTMSFAQKLYEGIELADEETTGLITYMRTDSTRTSDEAKKAARKHIETQYGSEFLPEKSRHYAQKQKKKIQDAHEAIRPTSVSRTPESLKGKIDDPLWKLYDLIWRRFVASQMADAVTEVTTVEIASKDALFRAKGQKRLFPGFQKVYSVENGNSDNLPDFPKNLTCPFSVKLEDLQPKQHFTQPPPRYTEATLVKSLDELGIGRPSTYASIIGTLFDRRYIHSEKKKLVPTELGETVNKILVKEFPEIIEVGFTARMEEELDQVEEGKYWREVVRDFYAPFAQSLEKANARIKEIKKESQEDSGEKCEKCGLPMLIRWGRNGKFLSCSGFPKCKNSKPLVPPEATGKSCPKCGAELVVKVGRFGRFLGCSNYPQCRNIESISTGVKCPQPDCDGELVERGSKKGTFYACNRYPKCKFRMSRRPVDIPCDECGHSFMVQTSKTDEKQLTCPRCKATVESVKEETPILQSKE